MDTPAADTPAPYNHGDCPSVVEPDGKVLTVVTNAPSGDGQSGPSGQAANAVFYEYSPASGTGGMNGAGGSSGTDSWTLVPSPLTPPNTFGVGNRVRMLNLPNGQIFVSGTSDSSIWLYNPEGSPQPSWRPTITSISGPSAGEFTLNGTQLNGLTNGADFGDDAKQNTNFPIVNLVSSTGNVYFARSYNFSQMAPKSGITGSCKLPLPLGIPNGTYNVNVSANGVGSSNSKSLTVTGIHVTNLSRLALPPTPATRSTGG